MSLVVLHQWVMLASKMVDSYDHLMGTAQPAHMGSQSNAPDKEDVPLPKADPRGYDSTSNMRNYEKYPASFGEKASALFGSYRQMFYGGK